MCLGSVIILRLRDSILSFAGLCAIVGNLNDRYSIKATNAKSDSASVIVFRFIMGLNPGKAIKQLSEFRLRIWFLVFEINI